MFGFPALPVGALGCLIVSVCPWSSFCGPWSPFVFAGCLWLSWVAIGCLWLSLVVIGCPWLSLVVLGCPVLCSVALDFTDLLPWLQVVVHRLTVCAMCRLGLPALPWVTRCRHWPPAAGARSCLLLFVGAGSSIAKQPVSYRPWR